LARAGVKPWPKLFHNLRASRQTELLDRFSIKAVCDWLGNSQPVAIEHYAQVTTQHFADATATPTGPTAAAEQNGSEAESEAVAMQKAKQQAAASNGGDSQETQTAGENTGDLLEAAMGCELPRE